MSDNRVPVRANVWENLNIGTPDEDQPRPFVNGKRLSLVYDLSQFEEENGVLVRQPTPVDVQGQSPNRRVRPYTDITLADPQQGTAAPGDTQTAQLAQGQRAFEVLSLHTRVEHAGGPGTTETYGVFGEYDDGFSTVRFFGAEVEDRSAGPNSNVGFQEQLKPSGRQLVFQDNSGASIIITLDNDSSSSNNLTLRVGFLIMIYQDV